MWLGKTNLILLQEPISFEFPNIIHWFNSSIKSGFIQILIFQIITFYFDIPIILTTHLVSQSLSIIPALILMVPFNSIHSLQLPINSMLFLSLPLFQLNSLFPLHSNPNSFEPIRQIYSSKILPIPHLLP